jgi:hypothetical protein
MSLPVEQINEALAGFTDIEELSLGPRSLQGQYDLRVVLYRCSRQQHRASLRRHLRPKDNRLWRRPLSGPVLRAEDMRGTQLDRVSFHFVDKERDTVAFDCTTVDIKRSPQ